MNQWQLQDAKARLTRRDESLADFMQRSPLCGDETLDFSRQPDAAREIDL